jgi:hypothetical protein
MPRPGILAIFELPDQVSSCAVEFTAREQDEAVLPRA